MQTHRTSSLYVPVSENIQWSSGYWMGEFEISQCWKNELKHSVQSIISSRLQSPSDVHTDSIPSTQEEGTRAGSKSGSWQCLYHRLYRSPLLPSPCLWLIVALADVNAMEVVGSESSVALGALPLACVVARLNALEAEDVEALCQDCILHTGVAAWTC